MATDIKRVIRAKVDLNEPIQKTILRDVFVTESNHAHEFRIQLWRGSEHLPTSSGVVAGYFWRYKDGATIPLSGEFDVLKKEIVCVLPEACYAMRTVFSVTLVVDTRDIGSRTVKIPVFVGEGQMISGRGDVLYDPEGIVPSVGDIIAKFEEMDDAVRNASYQTELARLATDAANAAAEKIDNMTVSATESEFADAQISEKDGAKHIALRLPRGKQGASGGYYSPIMNGTMLEIWEGSTPDMPALVVGIDLRGKNFAILGTYETLDALTAAVPSPEQGDVYNVGESSPYDMYMWDTTGGDDDNPIVSPGEWILIGKSGYSDPGGSTGGAVQSVNGKTGAVVLTASDVNALPNTYTPPDQTAEQVGADPKGTADQAVSSHNTDNDAHNDLRVELSKIADRLNAFFDSDDATLDELSEIIAYVKSNKTLIDSITTSKVSVSDIVDNLTTNVGNRPLSAAQGVALKALIDAITVPTKLSQLSGDSTHRVVTDAEKTAWNGKLDSSELDAAVNDALEQAKASGEFDGAPGDPGYTPVRGTDYWTEADKASIVQEVSAEASQTIANELAKRGQLKPEFANSVAECTDTSKLYVLPDGYIYGYILTTVTVPDQPQYTNVLPTAIDSSGAVYNGTGYKNGYRLNSSATEKEQADAGHTGFIKISSGQNNTIRMKNLELCADGHHYVHGYDASFVRQGQALQNSAMLTKDSDGVVTFDVNNSAWEYIRISNGVMNPETIITVNEEIKTVPGGTTTRYQWASTGHAFVPADYEDRIIAVENRAEDNAERIAKLESKPASSAAVTMYISPTGDDTNNGLSVSAPKKTVKACVEAGATRISAKRGVYAEAINLLNVGSLEIFPTDNNKTYVTGETRTPIVFDTSDSIAVSALATYNSIKRVSYSNANAAYDAVFVQKTLEPVASASQSSYRAALWLFSADEKTVCRKPKPVLTVAECEANANTFCYSSGYIYINADLTGVTKIIAPTITTSGFYVKGMERLVLNEVEVRYSGEYNFDLWDCAWVDLYKCTSKYTTRASGFHPCNTNGVFRACYATKCFDGFAPNYHGHTTYIDCVSEFNFDDGMSHHAASEGTVIGGRYEGNGKAGNIPAYGAKVNIYGGLYKDNGQFGICYAGDGAGNFASGMVQGAVIVGNPKGLVVDGGSSAIAMNCTYHDNIEDKEYTTGTLTEY